MSVLKPIKYEKDGQILLCCPKCESNVDWTYKTEILGLPVLRWRNRGRRKCIHCNQEIDWEGLRGNIIIGHQS